MIGREYEKEILDHRLTSARHEFVVVYGRRRVGKTYQQCCCLVSILITNYE